MPSNSSNLILDSKMLKIVENILIQLCKAILGFIE